jgi:hypothetical protein
MKKISHSCGTLPERTIAQLCIGVNLNSNACPTYALPPLIPPMDWGEKEIQFPPQYIRGGLGWGNVVSK